MTSNRKPNLFIVGAPKCGTSSMVDYLNQHPDIFLPEIEPHYFGSDLYRSDEFPHGAPRTSLEDYLRNFDAAGAASVVGEKSVCYLHSLEAPSEINEFAPDSRIIIMLRNPVDFIFSWHAQQVFTRNELIRDIGVALDAEPQRLIGERIPEGIDIASKLFYRRIADFAEGIQRYHDVFGKERVKTILLDDLSHDPGSVYRETLEFLGVDPAFQAEFRVVNSRKAVRSRQLNHLVREPSPFLKRAVRAILPSTAMRKRLGRAVLRRFNAKHISSDPTDLKLRYSLQEEMAPQIIRLSDLLEVDLTHWIPEHARSSIA